MVPLGFDGFIWVLGALFGFWGLIWFLILVLVSLLAVLWCVLTVFACLLTVLPFQVRLGLGKSFCHFGSSGC